MSAQLEFSEAMLDALRELMSIGVGRAAHAISELTGQDVSLRVLEIEVVELGSPIVVADLQGPANLRVSQAFSGALQGHALFVLNRTGAIRLAQLLLGKSESEETFDELEQNALLELGNIVIGASVGLLANELNLPVRYELPQFQLRGLGALSDLFADLTDLARVRVLITRASLALRDDHVTGYLILLFPEPGFHALAEGVARLAP
jgi:chemotaxis protein CheC